MVVFLVNDEHRERGNLRQRVTRSRHRVIGFVLPLLLAACAPTQTSVGTVGPLPAVVSTSSPTRDPSSAQRTLDPESPYQTTPEEYALQLKACLADKGFVVEIDPYDFHFSGNVGSESGFKELKSALAECRDSIDPSRNEPPPPLSEDQLRALYRYYVAQAACLVSAGYPASSAPPEQVFIDSDGEWNPHMGAEDPLDIPQPVTRSCEQVQGRPAFLDW